MKMDPKVVLEDMLKRLHHNHVSVRIHAVKVLSWIGNPSTVAPLIEALRDENDGVRFQAANSLKKLASVDLGDNYDEWKSWYSENNKR